VRTSSAEMSLSLFQPSPMWIWSMRLWDATPLIGPGSWAQVWCRCVPAPSVVVDKNGRLLLHALCCVWVGVNLTGGPPQASSLLVIVAAIWTRAHHAGHTLRPRASRTVVGLARLNRERPQGANVEGSRAGRCLRGTGCPAWVVPAESQALRPPSTARVVSGEGEN